MNAIVIVKGRRVSAQGLMLEEGVLTLLRGMRILDSQAEGAVRQQSMKDFGRVSSHPSCSWMV